MDENEEKNAVEERMKNLSKGKKEAEEKAQIESEARVKAEADAEASKKETAFYQGFSDSVAKYPNANEFKDSIKEKVMSGYSVEDATVAVLAKEGKFTAPTPERQSPAGGSASNQIGSAGGAKPIGEMSRDEKRATLLDLQAHGDITNQ